jgi:hypothetical protein
MLVQGMAYCVSLQPEAVYRLRVSLLRSESPAVSCKVRDGGDVDKPLHGIRKGCSKDPEW